MATSSESAVVDEGPGQDALIGVDWELSWVANQERSRRVAWRVAAVAALVALVEAIAIAVLTPMHSIVPYVVSVDRYEWRCTRGAEC